MDETKDEEKERLERDAKRAREMEEIPFQKIDELKWPKGVRQIAMGETSGFGIDRDGRLHWNGKPVEIIGRRLDLTRTQAVFAIIVGIATIFGMLATCVQGWTAFNDWACKFDRPAVFSCPKKPAVPDPGNFAG